MSDPTYASYKVDSIKDYFNEIARYPLLTPEQEISLSRQVEAFYALPKTGQLSADQRRTQRIGQRAKNKLIQCNLRLVVHVAKQYTRRLSGNNLELMDLIQEGTFGLVRAVELFDSTKGYKFSTYAYWWVRQAITRGIDTKERLIRIPQQGLDRVYKAERYRRAFMQEHGRFPTLREIAEGIDVDVKQVALLLERNRQASSLDALSATSDVPLIELIADDSKEEETITLQQHDREQLLNTALACLTPQEFNAISMRYGLGGKDSWSMAAIARHENLSRERIRQRIQAAHVKLRLALRGASAVPPAL